jgi:ankyrin repeat protein
MKKLFIAFATVISLSAQAQKNTLLDQSFWQNKPEVSLVKAEVEKGNNPSQLNPSGFDPVVMAINSGASNELVKYLLAQPGNEVTKLTHDGRIYLHWAASRGNVELMEHLIAKGSKANVEDNHGMTVLNFAATGGQQNTQVYDLCLKNGADLKKDLNHDGANALLLVISNDKDFKLTDYFVLKGLSLKSTDA